MSKDVIFSSTKQNECALPTWLSQIMKPNTSLVAEQIKISPVLSIKELNQSQTWVNFYLTVCYVMFLAVETVPCARRQISGENGWIFFS